MRSLPATLGLGSISTATMRPEDLIPSFLWETDHLRLSKEERQKVADIEKRSNADEYFETEDADFDLNELFDILGNHVPPFCDFGSHPGDGADYGVWVSDEALRNAIEDGEMLVQNDSFRGRQDEVPTGYTGYLLRISDHGNQLLLRYVKGRSWEVW